MKRLQDLLDYNLAWAQEKKSTEPDFFKNLSKQQTPNFLWIGCSDSRVPETQISQQNPGDIFVHRNIANLVLHSDMNLQSVLQYAVEVLKVGHVIVCGHYGCGGIKAALEDQKLGLIDNWLRNIKDLYQLHKEEIDSFEKESERVNRLSELNVEQQVRYVCDNPFVRSEWASGRDLWVHGWVYDLETGLIKDLEVTVGKKDCV
ncbi:carbonic anhydrase [Rhodohalobacter sp. 614A]|uniref:carbonic anhydrase n=1 Tax=Rhodohalobacter sp. 614A TaxID=2908649 RepID=UPI001F25A651